MSYQVSITTDFQDDGGPIEPKLAMFAEAGFTHIHWCEHWSRDVLYEEFYTAGVRRILARLGLKLLDTHGAQTENTSLSSPDEAVRRRGVRLLQNRIAFTAALGGDAVVVHIPPVADPKDPAVSAESWKLFKQSLNDMLPLCENLKIRLALENGGQPQPMLREFVEKFPQALVGYCYDSGHANIAKEPQLIDALAPRLAVLHLHDNYGQKDEHALPGNGNVDWEHLTCVLRAHRYAKPLNLELILRDQKTEPREFLKEAHRLGVALAEKSAVA